VRFLLDANLSPDVARLLKKAEHDAIHVSEVGLLSAPDPEIMEAAAQEGRILLTADADFGALGSRATPSRRAPALRRPPSPRRAGRASNLKSPVNLGRPRKRRDCQPDERSSAS
jgi:hypothetical protein